MILMQKLMHCDVFLKTFTQYIIFKEIITSKQIVPSDYKVYPFLRNYSLSFLCYFQVGKRVLLMFPTHQHACSGLHCMSHKHHHCSLPSCSSPLYVSGTSWFVIYGKGLRELIWLPMSPKLTYLFRSTSWKNSRVKRAWAGVVEGWVTYREVIRDSVRVRPKHGERSGGDCRVSKQWFRSSEKLTDRPLERDGAHGPRERTWVAH